MRDSSHRYAVVVAGGSGTRLWPLSRRNLPKQMQKFIGDKTLIDETVDRLTGLIPKENIFISTTGNYGAKIKELLPEIPADNIIVEPVAKGTPAAFALFARTIHRKDPDATIFSLASDHAVTGVDQFQQTLSDAYDYIESNPSNIALAGIKPTHPDTGLGYIKTESIVQQEPLVYSVEKYVEKPSLEVAKDYVESGEYYWNAAYYCFKAATLIEAYQEADPAIINSIDSFLSSGDIEEFMSVPVKAHEIEIINTAKYPLTLIPADFKWSDIGNWGALHQILAEIGGKDTSNVSNSTHHVDVNSSNCLVFSTDDKLVATVGLNDVIVVSTDDALLVMDKNQPQEIKKLIQSLKDKGLTDYL